MVESLSVRPDLFFLSLWAQPPGRAIDYFAVDDEGEAVAANEICVGTGLRGDGL